MPIVDTARYRKADSPSRHALGHRNGRSRTDPHNAEPVPTPYWPGLSGTSADADNARTIRRP